MDFVEFAKSAAGLITAAGSLFTGLAALLLAWARLRATNKRPSEDPVKPPLAERQRGHPAPSARSKRSLKARGLLLFGLLFVAAGSALFSSRFYRDTVEAPTIHLTQLPMAAGGGPDSTAPIAGRVHGLRAPQKYKIVVYARTDRWYVQPAADQPLTYIQPDGSWSNRTHLGFEYAALLVKPTYRPPSIAEALPSGSDEVLAVETRTGAK